MSVCLSVLLFVYSVDRGSALIAIPSSFSLIQYFCHFYFDSSQGHTLNSPPVVVRSPLPAVVSSDPQHSTDREPIEEQKYFYLVPGVVDGENVPKNKLTLQKLR